MSPIVQIRNLHKTFHPRRRLPELLRPWRPRPVVPALQGVDLEVDRGELVVLVGPNGAGKTTLLEVLADLVAPDAGEVWVDGLALGRAGAGLRGRVGYVLTEERSFFLRLTVRQNLQFFAALEGMAPASAGAGIEAAAARLGLLELLDRRVAELSRGQKQRVGIARGLLADPPLLLFDEATRALDPGRTERFLRLVREVLVGREGKTVLFATHRLEEAERLADRAVLMREGRIAAEGRWPAVRAAAEAAFAAEADAEDAALARLLGERDR